MSGAVEKTLAILEYLAARPDGAALAAIATDLNQLRSACHRTLHELIGYGYVRAMPQRGDYALTTKVASMGLSFLSKSGVVDIAQPLIERLDPIAAIQMLEPGPRVARQHHHRRKPPRPVVRRRHPHADVPLDRIPERISREDAGLEAEDLDTRHAGSEFSFRFSCRRRGAGT